MTHDQEHSRDHGEHQNRGNHHHEPAPGATELVRCPVMPENLVNTEWAESSGLYRDYQGTRYWFCCPECGPLWDADPARYVLAS